MRLRPSAVLHLLVTAALLAAGMGLAAQSAKSASLNVRDGSTNPPKLLIFQNLWGFQQYPSKAQPLPMEEQLSRLKTSGFDGFDFAVFGEGLPDAAVRDWQSRASKYGLLVGLEVRVHTIAEFDKIFPIARTLKPTYLDLHVGTYFVPEAEARELLRGLIDRVTREGMPVVVQTHRGHVTQDLLRTVAHAEAIPHMRFDLDLSHYVVAGGLSGDFPPAAMNALGLLMARTAMLDGRVSNGEQVQVDIGATGDTPHARRFATLWKQIMVQWLKGGQPGDVFPFRVELGPPGYAIVHPGTGAEISDRWEQTLVIKKLAERLWNEAVRETGIGWPHGVTE
jgi:hypothetical protein